MISAYSGGPFGGLAVRPRWLSESLLPACRLNVDACVLDDRHPCCMAWLAVMNPPQEFVLDGGGATEGAGAYGWLPKLEEDCEEGTPGAWEGVVGCAVCRCCGCGTC